VNQRGNFEFGKKPLEIQLEESFKEFSAYKFFQFCKQKQVKQSILQEAEARNSNLDEILWVRGRRILR
jgi:hypothetical protein